MRINIIIFEIFGEKNLLDLIWSRDPNIFKFNGYYFEKKSEKRKDT